MFSGWTSLAMLALESSSVIALRLAKMSRGGAESVVEAQLMVSEKADASRETFYSLMEGASVVSIIDRYRVHVAANQARLSIS